jgi:hypothetical protein
MLTVDAGNFTSGGGGQGSGALSPVVASDRCGVRPCQSCGVRRQQSWRPAVTVVASGFSRT